MSKLSSERLLAGVEALRSTRPLVLNLTNMVAMDLTANALLAVGASPLMAHAPEEIPELVALSSALVLNLGTLDRAWVESANVALWHAWRARRPVVLDPAGSGASRLRTDTARALLDGGGVSVLRANPSEALSLLGSVASAHSLGVDSDVSAEDVIPRIEATARRQPHVTVISGRVDTVLSADRRASVDHGDPLMGRVTAMGCAASAIVAAFLAVEPDAFLAAVYGMTVMGLAGEAAGARSRGPGSFRVEFVDALADPRTWNLGNLRVDVP